VPSGQRDRSLRPYSRFSRQGPLLFYQVAPQLYSRGCVDPVPDPLRFFLVVPGIEPGPPDLLPRTLTTRPQRRSLSTVSLNNSACSSRVIRGQVFLLHCNTNTNLRLSFYLPEIEFNTKGRQGSRKPRVLRTNSSVSVTARYNKNVGIRKTNHLCSQLYLLYIHTTTCFGLHRPSSSIAYTKCELIASATGCTKQGLRM
jgi:hypothetical protein